MNNYKKITYDIIIELFKLHFVKVIMIQDQSRQNSA